MTASEEGPFPSSSREGKESGKYMGIVGDKKAGKQSGEKGRRLLMKRREEREGGSVDDSKGVGKRKREVEMRKKQENGNRLSCE